jgi:short chain dehydrogenase
VTPIRGTGSPVGELVSTLRWGETMDRPGIQRRGFLIAAAATSAVGAARAQSGPASVQTDNAPKDLACEPMPEPSPAQSSGPVAPGRGSNLSGKVAVVTGAARGIGRAIAVELAANGADIVAVDIAGPVSPASNAVPATPEEMEETGTMIRALGRRAETVRADIRDIAALQRIADETDQQFGKIDIVVANAAIQRWKPLLEMEDSD